MLLKEKKIVYQRLEAIHNGIDQNFRNFSESDITLLIEALTTVNVFVESKRPFFYKKIIVVSVSQKMSTRTLQLILKQENIVASVTFLSKGSTIKKYNLQERIIKSEDTLFLIGEVPHSIKGSQDLVAYLETNPRDNAVVLRGKKNELKLTKESLVSAIRSKIEE